MKLHLVTDGEGKSEKDKRIRKYNFSTVLHPDICIAEWPSKCEGGINVEGCWWLHKISKALRRIQTKSYKLCVPTKKTFYAQLSCRRIFKFVLLHSRSLHSHYESIGPWCVVNVLWSLLIMAIWKTRQEDVRDWARGWKLISKIPRFLLLSFHHRSRWKVYACVNRYRCVYATELSALNRHWYKVIQICGSLLLCKIEYTFGMKVLSATI